MPLGAFVRQAVHPYTSQHCETQPFVALLRQKQASDFWQVSSRLEPENALCTTV